MECCDLGELFRMNDGWIVEPLPQPAIKKSTSIRSGSKNLGAVQKDLDVLLFVECRRQSEKNLDQSAHAVSFEV